MTFISHAQNLEDVMLWRALRNLRVGFYIDVGASSPDKNSVTRAFYDRGWLGINIPAAPKCFQDFVTRRDRDINLRIASSEARDEAAPNVVAANVHDSSAWPTRNARVQETSLRSAWDDHVPAGQDVHFIKINDKGQDPAIIADSNWTRNRPWIVLIEAAVPISEGVSSSEWDTLLREAGYDWVYWDGLTRFYLASEKPDLKHAFLRPPNASDDFVTADHAAERSKLSREVEAWRIDVQFLREDLYRIQEGQEKALADLKRESEARRALEQALKTQERNSERLRSLVESLEQSEQKMGYLSGRPLWERFLFRETGKPKRPLRRILFHTGGKPRAMFRHLVQHKNGCPRSPFRRWMYSEHHRSFLEAVNMPGADAVASSALSRRQSYFMTRLQSARICKEKT